MRKNNNYLSIRNNNHTSSVRIHKCQQILGDFWNYRKGMWGDVEKYVYTWKKHDHNKDWGGKKSASILFVSVVWPVYKTLGHDHIVIAYAVLATTSATYIGYILDSTKISHRSLNQAFSLALAIHLTATANKL